MADETVSLEVLIEAGNSAQTLGELRSSFNKLNEEIEKVDVNSDEFKKLQGAIAKTGGRVKNLELSLESLNKEQIASAIGGVAGGIGSITSALVIMGGENETIEKMTENISNAMAISMGLKGAIESMSFSYKIFNNLLKANAMVMRLVALSSKILKIALISTGIGAIVVALGVLATNLDTVKAGFKNVADFLYENFKPAIDAVIESFKLQWRILKFFLNPLIDATVKLLEEFGIKETENEKIFREANESILKGLKERSEELKNLQEVQKETHDLAIAQMNREIALAKANGEDVTELERQRFKASVNQAKVDLEFSRQRANALAEEIKIYIKLNNFRQEEVDKFFEDLEARTKAVKDNKENLRNVENSFAVFEASIITEKRNKDNEAYKQRRSDRKSQQDEFIKDTIEFNKRIEEQEIKFLADKLAREQKAKADADAWELSSEELAMQEEEEAFQAQLLLEQQREEALLKQQQEAQDKKRTMLTEGLALASNSLNMLSSINTAFLEKDLAQAGNNEAKKEQLRKESFEREKKLNIAKAVINGAQAVMQVLASTPPPLSFALASGTALLTGLQISAIKNAKYNGGASSTPSLNIGSNTSSSGEGVGIEPVSNTSTVLGNQKVFVTETDITSTQDAVSVIQEQSVF